MGRYIGARAKIDRRFNYQVFGFSKSFQKRSSIPKKGKRKGRISEYGILLRSKKFVLYLYNMRERQLSNYIEKATKKKENTEDVLVKMLESRLDNVVYRLGLGKTRRFCRQMVSHKHITVNGKIVNIASYSVKVGDIIKLTDKAKNNKNICNDVVDVNVFGWLKWDAEKSQGEVIGIPVIKDVPEKDRINFKNIVEFYSR